MSITTSLAACSTIVSNNGPDGSVDAPSTLDDAIRYALSFVATLRDTRAPIDSPTFTTIASGPTPVQFDNTPKLATTSFVQRALGNYQVYSSISSATPLPISQAGQVIELAGALIFTTTLPSASGYAGAAYTINNFTVNNQTIASSSLFYGPLAQGVTSFSLYPGISCTAVSDGTNWKLLFSSQKRMASASGYQYHEGGIILQWGSVVTNGTGSATATFPIAFPNTFFAAGVSANSSLTGVFAAFNTPTLGSILVDGWQSSAPATRSAVDVRYWAIGN